MNTDLLYDLVLDSENKIELYKAPQDLLSQNSKEKCEIDRNLNIVVVCAPCHGFGDVIFATKFAKYLYNGITKKSKPYSKKVTIVTPTPQLFKQLDIKGIPIKELKGKVNQCRRLKNFERPSGLGTIDLIFIAPLQADYDVDYTDVRGLFKESTPFNTIFLTEYQSSLKSIADFRTGVGEKYNGLLFDGHPVGKRLNKLGKEPYALAYIAQDVGLPTCMDNFIKMVVVKYHTKYPTLQIVLPEWGLHELNKKSFINFIKKYYPTIIFQSKKDTKTVAENSLRKKLILRGDIFPVPRQEMLSIMKHSIQDILVTGDQSVTDAIDCCDHKNIWYQTVPWKITLAKALAKELPQKYLSKSSTSCGTLKAIKWNSKGTDFKNRHDFRIKSKKQLNNLFCLATMAKRKDTLVYKYLQILQSTVSFQGSKNKLLDFLE